MGQAVRLNRGYDSRGSKVEFPREYSEYRLLVGSDWPVFRVSWVILSSQVIPESIDCLEVSSLLMAPCKKSPALLSHSAGALYLISF